MNRAAFHTIVLMIVLFLSPRLVQEPFLSKLPYGIALAVLVGAGLFVTARRTYRTTRSRRDLGADRQRIYFNPNVSPIEKLMFMDQTTGCSSLVAALGYLSMAVYLFALWWFKTR